jgi:hypothetical protein
MNEKAALRLYTPDGKKEIVARASSGVKWEAYPYPQIQHAPAENELVMFENEITPRPDEVLYVVRWNYATNQVRRDEVKIADLFKQGWRQLQPKGLVPITESTPD